MRVRRNQKREKGIAILIALLALLLISAIGMALLYSSNFETVISGNYRDKQVAVYAAMSGLQESRDRLFPNSDPADQITLPGGLPSLAAKNVIYVINPAAGETVAPWDPTNKYADTELCQENVLGLSGTAGTPCSGSGSLPAGTNWFTKYDNSSGYTGAYKTISAQMPYKWTRITLKADNTTPVHVADGTSGKQVCWDGKNQMALPSGYNADCLPNGSVATIKITNAGSGFTSAPTVTITGGGGTGATAVANLATRSVGSVANISVDAPGSNYSQGTTVQISGDGTGATATATISKGGAPLASVALDTTGQTGSPGCYPATVTPNVSLNPAVGDTTGAGATATAQMTATTPCILNVPSLSITGCSSYGTSTQTLGVSGNGGSGFALQVNFVNNAAISWTVKDPGTGYTSTPKKNDVVIGGGCRVSAVSFTMGRNVSSLTLQNPGDGYTAVPIVKVDDPSPLKLGYTPKGKATLGTGAEAGQITGVTVTAGGSGYSAAPTVTFIDPSGTGSGAVATAVLGNMSSAGALQSVTVTAGGTGYRSTPTVTISGGGGTGATATASITTGKFYAPVLVLTSLARTALGTRAMAQMEVAMPIPTNADFAFPSALTLVGPTPVFKPGNSAQFGISGVDANSCGETAYSPKPAIGVYDDPAHPTSPTALQSVLSAIPGGNKAGNYTGAQTTADVENVYSQLGDQGTTPAAMENVANAIASLSYANIYNTNPDSIALGTASLPAYDVVNGDLNVSGTVNGYGVLVVRGTLTLSGNFSWNGVVLVIGKGAAVLNGGGNGNFVGSLVIANTTNGTATTLDNLGTPVMDWTGGGGNGIQYDHCFVENYMANVPYFPPPGNSPLRVLSMRTLSD